MSVGQACQMLATDFGFDVSPRQLSILLYTERLGVPLVAGRRDVSREALPRIVEALRSKGKLTRVQGA